MLPLFTADDDLRVPEVVAVPEPDLVVLPELLTVLRVVLLTVLRELTDLEEPEVLVSPVEASLELAIALVDTVAPEDSATALDDALETAADTPSALLEPVVANDLERTPVLVAPAPATDVPFLRP